MRPIGLQLYTVRELFAADPEHAWAVIAELGLDAVEPHRLVGHEDTLLAIKQRLGLQMPSVHTRMLDPHQQATVFAAAARVGIPTVIQPTCDPDQWRSPEGVGALARQLNDAAAVAADHGVTVGYHNHAFEFAALDAPLERLSALLDERVVLELDTYWAAVGGEDPVTLLGRLGERVQFLHVKDGPITHDPYEQTAVGEGAMPVREILDAAEHALAIVELDAFRGDVCVAVESSIRSLREWT